jgi:hypothetical protein
MKSMRLVQLTTVAFVLWAGASLRGDEPAPPPSGAKTAEPAVALWTAIKDCTFDQKTVFFTGFARLEALLDKQIAELAVRRAGMKEIANTKEWDFAMKELGNARSYLKGTGEVLAKALPETWVQEREKVGLAWMRAQAAYAAVTASTTT